MADLFVQALMVHLVGDWILQSDRVARLKTDLRQPAAWQHSGIHALGLLLVFPPAVALLVALSHLLIDTRRPLLWLRQVLGQQPEGDRGRNFEIWQDQVVHLLVLFMAAAWVSKS